MGQILRQIKLFLLIALKIFRRKWKTSLAAFLIICAVSFLAIIEKPVGERKLSEGIIGTYQNHDLPEIVTRLVSSSLVEADKNGRVVGKLVEGWEVNNDATVFKFKLKKNLQWSDGSGLKSSDLEFGIPDVEASFPDDRTVQFKLKDSFSPFPSLLTKPVFKKDTLIGSGPYMIKKIEKSRIFITKMILTPQSDKNLPQLIIRFYPNEKTAHLAFELGEIQTFFGAADVSQISENPRAKLMQRPAFTRIVSILYNTKDPVLSNRSFRQALSYSAPKISGENPAKTPILPYSWAFSGEVKHYLSNEEAAKSALKRAKSSSSEDALQKEIILTSTPQLENIGQQVIASWKKLGIKVVLRVESGIPQNFQAALLPQTIPSDPDQYSLWHSTQTKTNLTKYSSARVDKDLEDGRKLLKEDERKLRYADFQKSLLEDSPATFLYFPKYNIIYLKKAESLLNKVLPLQLN